MTERDLPRNQERLAFHQIGNVTFARLPTDKNFIYPDQFLPQTYRQALSDCARLVLEKPSDPSINSVETMASITFGRNNKEVHYLDNEPGSRIRRYGMSLNIAIVPYLHAYITRELQVPDYTMFLSRSPKLDQVTLTSILTQVNQMTGSLFRSSGIATAVREIWEYMEKIRNYESFVLNVQKETELPGKTLLIVGGEQGSIVEATLRGQARERPPQWDQYVNGLSRRVQRRINSVSARINNV